jgi:hypothetical protein
VIRVTHLAGRLAYSPITDVQWGAAVRLPRSSRQEPQDSHRPPGEGYCEIFHNLGLAKKQFEAGNCRTALGRDFEGIQC